MTFRDLKYLMSSLSLALIHCSFWPCTSNASINHFHSVVLTDPDLSHQFTFDGYNEQDRLEDKIGDAYLNPRPFGSGTANDIEYAKEGYDETSDSVSTSRGPGNCLLYTSPSPREL